MSQRQRSSSSTTAPYFTLTVRLVEVEGGTHMLCEQVFEDSRTAQAVKDIVEQNLDRLTRVLAQAAGTA